jgi:hypothetical protein
MWRSGRRSHRLLGAVTLTAFSLGCTSWQTQRAAPDAVIAGQTNHVRVLQSNGAPGGVDGGFPSDHRGAGASGDGAE